MSDRSSPARAAAPISRFRVLGDPALGTALRAALEANPASADAAPSPLDLFASRRRDLAGAARAAVRSTRRGRALLRAEIAWGRAVVGPLTRPGEHDACAGCALAGGAPDLEPAEAGFAPARAAEPALLPGLVGAIVASELDLWRRGLLPAAINAELHIVPYRSWAAATRPVLVRETLTRRPSCSFCGETEPATSARVQHLVTGVFTAQHPVPGGLRPSSRGTTHGRYEGDEAWTRT